MDSKNECDLDMTMEPKSHYKLRSSLKKTKSRNPLGSLDVTDITIDTTIVPPPRRVSFAASNYVKPFMDDPEKNTIWDNTYEEEVNHTDSTKSENTNHTMSELKSHCQEVTNLDIQQSHLRDQTLGTHIYCDQDMLDIEDPVLHESMINEDIRNVSSDNSLDVTSCIPPNIDVKSTTQLSKETTFHMDFTCQWKNNIIGSSMALQKEISTKKDHLLKDSTLHQEMDMSMTCCFGNSNSVPNDVLETINQHKQTENKSVAMTAVSENVENKENIPVPAKKQKAFVLDQSEMEFTCTFPNNILEMAEPCKETEVNSLPVTTIGENKENVISPADKTEYIPTMYAKNEKNSEIDQSEMEYTCAFSNNILEPANPYKETGSNSLVINKEKLLGGKAGVPTFYAKNDKVSLLNQSEMEFTCAFPNRILETVRHCKEIEDNSCAMKAGNENVENKKKILIFDDHEGCVPKMYGHKDKVNKEIDQSEMEFTCTFSNKILESVHQSKVVTVVSENVENKENIIPVNNAKSFSMLNTKKESLLPNQSEMEFTCKFPSKILETVNHPEGTKRTSEKAEKRENLSLGDPAACCTVYCVKNVSLPNQSGQELLKISNRPKDIETNSLAVPRSTENVQNKENIFMGDLQAVHDNKSNIDSINYKSDLEIACSFLDKINVTENQCNKTESNCLALSALSGNARNKEIAIFHDLAERPSAITDEKEEISPSQNKSLQIKSYLNNPEIELTAKFDGSGAIIGQRCGNELTVNECSEFNDNLSKSRLDNKQNLPLDFSNSYNTYTVGNKSGSQPNQGASASQNMLPPEPKNKVKPVKVREFGNIPIAMDVTDVSIDQNMNDHVKSVPVSSKPDQSLKENTYTISVAQSEKSPFQLKEDTIVGPQVNKNPLSKSNTAEPQQDFTSFNEYGENVMRSTFTVDKNTVPEISRKQDQLNPKGTNAFVSKIEPDPLETTENFSKELPGKSFKLECKEFTEKNISYQSQINSSTEKSECLIPEECTLIDSMEESILINSLTIPDEEAQKSLDVNFTQTEIQSAEPLQKENHNHTLKEDLPLLDKNPITKVIYSEPMKVKPLSHEFPSMQTSTMNPFNFSSIGSLEDTQQLIQATFSKPSFLKTEQFENEKGQSGSLPESSVLESNDNEFNRNDSVAFQNETLKTESVLQNIQKKLVRAKFESIKYDDILESIKTHKEINQNVKTFLLNYKFPEIPSFNLQEKTRKLSLVNMSSDGNSSDSLLEVLESVEDNNCNKSMLLEHAKSLHEKIIDVCDRSNKLLSIKHYEDTYYIFTTMYECLMIYVQIHPEDGRVVEIQTAASLKDSADVLLQFLVKNVIDKLRESTLKSYLGPYYDVLSLLDHICLTVDEVTDFNYEFFSLQKLYSTLRIHSDYRMTFEILHTNQPIWWIIRLGMTSVNKINPETLQLESLWGSINEEHIKQILRNIDEGVDSLRNFISEVLKYFERTRLRYK